MPIDPNTAAALAAEHGLSSTDAGALVDLADDDDHARRIAERFAEADPHAYVRRLFGRNDAIPEPPPDPRFGNTAPREGGNPSPVNNSDLEFREFARYLFGRNY